MSMDERFLGAAIPDHLPVGSHAKPIDMILHCPKCGMQHIDGPEETADDFKGDDEPDWRTTWNNPPHRSHLCHKCGTIWRPADVPTNGVRAITTRGKADTWPPVECCKKSEPGMCADCPHGVGLLNGETFCPRGTDDQS